MEYTHSQHHVKWVKLKYFSIGSKIRQNIMFTILSQDNTGRPSHIKQASEKFIKM